MSINKFDRLTLRLLGDEVFKALEPIAIKHGLTIRKHGGSFTELTYTPKFEFLATSADGKPAKQKEFERYCGMFDLRPEDFGKTFQGRDGAYTLVGLEMSRRKYPILGKNALGSEKLFTIDTVLRQLRRGDKDAGIRDN